RPRTPRRCGAAAQRARCSSPPPEYRWPTRPTWSGTWPGASGCPTPCAAPTPLPAPARRSGHDLEMHPRRRAESGQSVTAGDEADPRVERTRMLVRGDLDTADPAAARHRRQGLHQRAPRPPPPPPGVDEQILKLDPIPGAEPGSEAGDAVIGDCGSRASLAHREIGKLEGVGMGEQVRPITVVGQR